MENALYTIWIFTKINTRRFFRNRTAIFFNVLFPLIFLFVLGGIFGGNSGPNFTVAIIQKVKNKSAQKFRSGLEKSEIFNVDKKIETLKDAKDKMSRGQLDAIIILPENFGAVKKGTAYPSGTATIAYTQNNAQSSQALASILQDEFDKLNSHFVKVREPFTVQTKALNMRGLTRFDYTFAGLLGFAIVGMGIFGPVNVFPELKKQGILRRLHTTPLKVWQYFLATAFSQSVVGLFSLAIFFATGIFVFGLNVVGNVIVLGVFIIFSIVTILGIGLAIGGWAENQSQAAPISNIIVFPMLMLSGTFFPRFIMPGWLKAASYYLPLTPVIDGTRLIITHGYGFTELGPQLLLLAIWAVVVYGIAFRVFRWE